MQYFLLLLWLRNPECLDLCTFWSHHLHVCLVWFFLQLWTSDHNLRCGRLWNQAALALQWHNSTMDILHHVIIDELIVPCLFFSLCFSVGIHSEIQYLAKSSLPCPELLFSPIVLREDKELMQSLLNLLHCLTSSEPSLANQEESQK